MMMLNKPYGKHERLLRREAARRTNLAMDMRFGRSEARVAIAVHTARKTVDVRLGLGDRFQSKMFDLIVKGICWVIERKMWRNGTKLDEKMELGQWLEMLTTGQRLCRKAVA